MNYFTNSQFIAIIGEICLSGRWWVIQWWRFILPRRFLQSSMYWRQSSMMAFQSSREMMKMSVHFCLLFHFCQSRAYVLGPDCLSTELLKIMNGSWLCCKHLDMLRWFVSTTFMIYVRDFHRNFMISWFVTVCICNFHDLCLRLSPWGSFSESWLNGIWVIKSLSLSRILHHCKVAVVLSLCIFARFIAYVLFSAEVWDLW